MRIARKFTSLGMATALVAGGALTAMAQDDAAIEIPPPGPELCADQEWEVGFANLVRDITFTIDVEESIQRAADATGCVNLSIFDNELDGATALANARNMITLGAQGVIEFQTDEKFGLVLMDEFRAEGIPVIAIDIPMPGATFFGADNYRAGFMAGEGMGAAFKERFPDSDPLLFLGELPQSGPVPAARMTGILEGVRSVYPELDDESQVVRFDSKNTLEESRTQMSNLIQTVPEGTKFMGAAINDGSTIGMQAAILTAGRGEDAILASQNADSTFREEVCNNPDSIILGSTAYFPEKYGDKLIPTILLLMQGQPVPPSVYVDHVFLTLDNMAEYYPDEECPALS